MITLEICTDVDALIDGIKEKYEEILLAENPNSIDDLREMLRQKWEDLIYENFWFEITEN